MSDQFKDYLVNVKLNNGLQVKGIVTNVVDRTLVLSKAVFPSGETKEFFNVNGLDIADLELLGKPPKDPVQHNQTPTPTSHHQPPQNPLPHADPSILSVSSGTPNPLNQPNLGDLSNPTILSNPPILQPVPTHVTPVPLTVQTPPIHSQQQQQPYYHGLSSSSSVSTPRVNNQNPQQTQPQLPFQNQPVSMPFHDPAILSAIPASSSSSQSVPLPTQQLLNMSINNPAPTNNYYQSPSVANTQDNEEEVEGENGVDNDQEDEGEEPEDDDSDDSSTDPAPYNANVDFEALEAEERNQRNQQHKRNQRNQSYNSNGRQSYHNNNNNSNNDYYYMNDGEYYGDERYEGTMMGGNHLHGIENTFDMNGNHNNNGGHYNNSNNNHNNNNNNFGYRNDADYYNNQQPQQQNRPKCKKNSKKSKRRNNNNNSSNGSNGYHNNSRYETGSDTYFEGNRARSGSGYIGKKKNGKEGRYPSGYSHPSGYSNHSGHSNSNYSQSQNGFESDGWAGEDLLDVKNTEFDFQASNKLFDKVQVFDEIRQQDTTNPDDRLVAFNKVRPGTNNSYYSQNPQQHPLQQQQNHQQYQPQAKYGHREMVIKHDHSHRWAAEDENVDIGHNQNGQHGNGGDEGNDDDDEVDGSQLLENTGDEEGEEDDDEDTTEDSEYLDDSVSNVSAILTASPPPLPQLRRMSRPQMFSEVKFVGSTTGKTIFCASPVQMVELERMTFMTFGISESILNENAGRGISEIALKTLGGTSRFAYSNHNLSPTVVIFAGNTRVGLRALAAGRHLANRQVNVVALVVGYEDTKNGNDKDNNEDDVLSAGRASVSDVKEQVKALQSCKASVVKSYTQFVQELRNIDSPPELIIDGLQGYQTTLDDFGEQDVATVVSSIEWANRQRAPIASLDIPSGLDGATGMTMNRGTESAVLSSLSSSNGHSGLLSHLDELRGAHHSVSGIGASSSLSDNNKLSSDNNNNNNNSSNSEGNDDNLMTDKAFLNTNGNKKLMKKSRWPHMNAKIILSCGLPITGLENAYLTGSATPGEWKHYVVDVGFPTGALQKGPLRRFGKVWFGADWVQQLEVLAK